MIGNFSIRLQKSKKEERKNCLLSLRLFGKMRKYSKEKLFVWLLLCPKKEISVFFRNVCERILTHRRNYLQFVIFLLCVFATAGHVFFKLEKSLITLNKKQVGQLQKIIKTQHLCAFLWVEDKKRQSFIRRKKEKIILSFSYNHLLPIDSDSNVKKSFWWATRGNDRVIRKRYHQ